MDENIFNKENTKERWWLKLVIALLIAGIAAALWFVFGNNSDTQPPATTSQSSQQTNSSSSVNSLISYQLPDGWKTVSCNKPTEVVLLVPQGKVSPDCASLAGNWPMKIQIDPANTTECSQIKVNNQQLTNHVCSSKFINGNKFLTASTTYNDKSTYGKTTKVSDYYVSAKGSVVKFEYADDQTSPEDDYQTQFDQIVNSVKLK
jgi:hypothetical protein